VLAPKFFRFQRYEEMSVHLRAKIGRKRAPNQSTVCQSKKKSKKTLRSYLTTCLFVVK
jgi:hypothetical protein